jgi:hypothetical protein
MPSSGMLCHVALVRTDVSEELSASIIRVTRIGELGTSAVTIKRHMLWRNTKCSVCGFLVMANVPSSPIPVTQIMEALSSSETSILTRATWCNIPEEGMLHSYCCEKLKSYTIETLYLSVLIQLVLEFILWCSLCPLWNIIKISA